MRFPYTFAVPKFGGRNWTMVSATLLFIPTIALAYFVARPDTPILADVIVAATAGLGGGNFASSMANISFFYPNRMKGWALGLQRGRRKYRCQQPSIPDADRDRVRMG